MQRHSIELGKSNATCAAPATGTTIAAYRNTASLLHARRNDCNDAADRVVFCADMGASTFLVPMCSVR